MKVNLFLVLILCITQLFFPLKAHSADPIMIGSPDIIETNLSTREIRDIYLGKKRKWQDNTEITITVIYKSETHNQFVKKYLRKTPAQFINYWKHLVFVGKGRFPYAFKNEKDMIGFIGKSKGFIGYTSTLPPQGSKVKVFKYTP